MAELEIDRNLDAATDSVTAVQGTPPFRVTSPLVPVNYDAVDLSYSAGNVVTSAVYKLGGLPVATLNFTYDGNGNLTSVARA